MAREEQTLEARIAALEAEIERLSRRSRTEEARLDENLRRFGIRGTRGKARLDRTGLQLKQGPSSYSFDDAAAITWSPEFFAGIDMAPGLPGTLIVTGSETDPTLRLAWRMTQTLDLQDYIDNGWTLTAAAASGVQQAVTLTEAAAELTFRARDEDGNEATLEMQGGDNYIKLRADDLFFEGAWHIYQDSVLTPAQITGNENNYAPTGHGNVLVMRLSSDAARDITGISTGTVEHRILMLVNVGSQNVVLKDEDANSLEFNRFALKADITLAPDGGVILFYDTVSDRWRCIGAY